MDQWIAYNFDAINRNFENVTKALNHQRKINKRFALYAAITTATVFLLDGRLMKQEMKIKALKKEIEEMKVPTMDGEGDSKGD